MDDWKSRIETELKDGAQELFSSIGGSLKRLLQQRELSDEELAASYRQAFSKRISSERSGLAGHTSAFIGVNAGITVLWAILATTTGAVFPWFLFPLFGWGIGYVSHRATVRVREAEYREVTAARHPTRKQLQIHRELWKVRRKWRGSLASSGMTIALLVMINVVTGGIGSFPWALIPSTFIGVGLFTHYGRFRGEEAELARELEDSGFRLESGPFQARSGGITGRAGQMGLAGGRSPGSALSDPAREAKALRAAILADVKKYAEVADALGSDGVSVLDQYVSQIESLNTTYEEVTELVRSIPVENLERDRLHVQRQLSGSTGGRLQEEYRRHLAQIEEQLRSHQELKSEQEILRLRVAGALQALNQLKIDVARTRSSRSAGNESAMGELRSRSVEISRYLEDLRSAWDEIS